MNENLHACICFLSHVPHLSQGGTVLCVVCTLCEPFDAVVHSVCAALDLKPIFSYTARKKPAQVGHQMRLQLNCDVNQCAPHLLASRQMAHPFVPHMQLVRALDTYLHTRFHACRQLSFIKEDVVSIWSFRSLLIIWCLLIWRCVSGFGQVITVLWTEALRKADLSLQLALLSILIGSFCLQLHAPHISHLLNTNSSLLFKHLHIHKSSGLSQWFESFYGSLTTIILKAGVLFGRGRGQLLIHFLTRLGKSAETVDLNSAWPCTQ